MKRDMQTKLEEQAALYALEMLSQTEARAFENDIAAGNADAAEGRRAFEAVAAELALGAPEAAPPASLRSRLLSRISDLAQPVAPADRAHETRKRELSSLAAQFLNIRANEGNWEQLAEGVSVKVLFVDAHRDTITSLVRLAPGGRLPRHRHNGVEESIVIEGDCRVNGEIFMPGDYRCAQTGTTDSEVTTEHGTMFLMVSPREIEVLEPEWNC